MSIFAPFRVFGVRRSVMQFLYSMASFFHNAFISRCSHAFSVSRCIFLLRFHFSFSSALLPLPIPLLVVFYLSCACRCVPSICWSYVSILCNLSGGLALCNLSTILHYSSCRRYVLLFLLIGLFWYARRALLQH